jgi:hypothetical protein
MAFDLPQDRTIADRHGEARQQPLARQTSGSMPEQPDNLCDADGAARPWSGDRGQALDERLTAAPFVATSPASQTQGDRPSWRSLHGKFLQHPMMPAVPRRRSLAADRAGSLSSPLRRQDPAAVAKLDLADFYSGTKGQFNSLSHAFVCTQDATLAIGSTECDEDPLIVRRGVVGF